MCAHLSEKLVTHTGKELLNFLVILYRRGLRHGYSVELSPLARIAGASRRNPEDLYRFATIPVYFVFVKIYSN